MNVDLPSDLGAQVAALAASLDRPESWVIEPAVRAFVALHAWQMDAIAVGLRAADAGQVVAHEEIVAWVQSWDKPGELPMPACA